MELVTAFAEVIAHALDGAVPSDHANFTLDTSPWKREGLKLFVLRPLRTVEFWRTHILRALDTETYFRQNDPNRVRDAALVHVTVIEHSRTSYNGPLSVEDTEFPHELTFRGLTVHLPLSILAAIPGTWRAEGMAVILGLDAVAWMFENRKKSRMGKLAF